MDSKNELSRSGNPAYISNMKLNRSRSAFQEFLLVLSTTFLMQELCSKHPKSSM